MITSVNNQLLVLRCPKHQFFYLAMPWSSLVMTSNIYFFDNQTKSVFKNNPSLFLHCETTKENLTSNLDQLRLIVCKLILKTKNPNICTAKWFFFSSYLPLGEKLVYLCITWKGLIMECFWCYFWIPHPKKLTWVKFQS